MIHRLRNGTYVKWYVITYHGYRTQIVSPNSVTAKKSVLSNMAPDEDLHCYESIDILDCRPTIVTMAKGRREIPD